MEILTPKEYALVPAEHRGLFEARPDGSFRSRDVKRSSGQMMEVAFIALEARRKATAPAPQATTYSKDVYKDAPAWISNRMKVNGSGQYTFDGASLKGGDQISAATILRGLADKYAA